MSKLIRRFKDGSTLEYDRGGFDDWCVFLTRPGKKRKPPRDVDYFNQVEAISSNYDKGDELEISIVFSVLYMAMVAEEKKEHTRLGKRIKRLGIYGILMENTTVEHAANFMKGMKWRDRQALR